MKCNILFSLLLIGFVHGQIYGQTKWSDTEDLPKIMRLLDANGVDDAIKYAIQNNVKPYDVGMKLLRHGDFDFAKRWYFELGQHTSDNEYYYGFAFVEWKSGDVSSALIDATFLLEKDPSPKLSARLHYLLGSIRLDARDVTKAKEHLTTSLKTYQELDLQGGVFLCNVMLADIAIIQKEFDQIESLLTNAQKANDLVKEKGKRPYSQGLAYEIRGKAALWEGNYVKALEFETNAYKEYMESEKPQWAKLVRVKIGLLQFLTGNPKEAYSIATDIWRETKDDKNQSMAFAYNEITQALIAKCAQETTSFEGHQSNINAWALGNPSGRDITELWEMVKNTPCPSIQE